MLHDNGGSKQLNQRQIDILRQVARGKTYREIGAAMNVSESTVKYHMNKILFTLNVATRTEAILHLQRQNRQRSA